MKKYTDIKIARYDLRKLTEMYNYCKEKKEKLNSTLTDNEPYDVRCEAYVYRLGLNEMQKRITELNKNIRQLDRELTKKVVRQKKEIYSLLIKLRDLSDAFNKMGGSLYSGICADEINEIIDTLNEKYGVEVSYYQPFAGRVSFTNLQSLIEKYEESDK